MANHISGTSKLNGTPMQARVTLVNSATNTIVASQLSDPMTGEWSFPNLPAGMYEVITIIPGYKARVDGPWMLNGMDTFYGNVVSLLHFDGSDASTTFTDEKGRVWTPSGDAQLDTAEKKFGTAAGLFDGAGDYLSTPDSEDFNFGGGNFTIETFFRIASIPGASGWRVIVSQREAPNSRHAFTLFLNENTGKPRFAFTSNGSTVTVMESNTAPSTNVWHHLAVSRSQTKLRMFLNGQKAAEMDVGSTTVHNSNQPVKIGANDHPVPGSYMDGWIDELRITKGVARYVNNFVPPAAAFPNA